LALTLIICIAIIFDLSEKMDNFLDNEAPLKAIIFDYYLNFIPYFANMFTSLFVFISVIFFTSRLAAKSETIAMFSGGISYERLLVPFFIAATVITVFSFVLGNYVIPKSNRHRIEFANNYISKGRSVDMIELTGHRQVAKGEYFYIKNYNIFPSGFMGYDVTLEKFEDTKLISKLSAKVMIWDTIKNKWILENYRIRNVYDDREDIIIGFQIDTSFNLTPEDFTVRYNAVQAMTPKELNEYIEIQKLAGTPDVINSEIEKYNRRITPFSTFILTIIGFALAVRKNRNGGIGLNIGIGLLLSFSYILFMRFTTVFAISGLFSAWLSVWIPNIIFAIIAIFVYFITRK